jgi:hypothetical protein
MTEHALGPRADTLAHVYADREGVRLSVSLWPVDVEEELRKHGLPAPADRYTPAPGTRADRVFRAGVYRFQLAVAQASSREILETLRRTSPSSAPEGSPASGNLAAEVKEALAIVQRWRTVGEYLLRRLAPQPLLEPAAPVDLPGREPENEPPYAAVLLDRTWLCVNDDLLAREEGALAVYIDPAYLERQVDPGAPDPAALAGVQERAQVLFHQAQALKPDALRVERDRLCLFAVGAQLAADLLHGIDGCGPVPYNPPGGPLPDYTRAAAQLARLRGVEAAAELVRLRRAAEGFGARAAQVMERRRLVRVTLLGRWLLEHAMAGGHERALRHAVIGDLATLGERASVEFWGAATAPLPGGGDCWTVTGGTLLPLLPQLVFQELVRVVLLRAHQFMDPAANEELL